MSNSKCIKKNSICYFFAFCLRCQPWVNASIESGLESCRAFWAQRTSSVKVKLPRWSQHLRFVPVSHTWLHTPWLSPAEGLLAVLGVIPCGAVLALCEGLRLRLLRIEPNSVGLSAEVFSYVASNVDGLRLLVPERHQIHLLVVTMFIKQRRLRIIPESFVTASTLIIPPPPPHPPPTCPHFLLHHRLHRHEHHCGRLADTGR